MDLVSIYYLAGILTAVGGVLIFLSKQLSQIKSLIYTKTEQLQEFFQGKLEYHEKHDDQRFDSINRDLWELRVANAARFGLNGKHGSKTIQRPDGS